MALLGKISAVITANATDFTRAIGGAKAELASLKKKVDGYRLNLDTNALDKTLTKLQLFRRTMQEAFKAKIDTGPLQDLYKAYEDLGKPLTKVKNQIESLSNSTQAYLYPALERAQKGFQDLYRDIASGSTTFDAQRGKIEALARAIERLKASTAVVSDFSKATAGLSVDGAGGTFVQPKALAVLKQAAELRKKAADLPAGAREDPFYQNMVREASVAAERIEALSAKIERAKLRSATAESVIARSAAAGRSAPASALNAAASAARDQMLAQSQMDREVEAQRVRNQALASRTSLAGLQDLQMLPPQVADEAEAVAGRVRKAIDSIRAVDAAGRFEPLVAALLTEAAAAEKAAVGTDAFAKSLARAGAQAESLQRLANATKSLEDLNNRSARSVDSLKSDAQRRREMIAEARAAGVPPDEVRASRRKSFLANELGGELGGAKRTLSGLNDALKGDFEARIDRAQRTLSQLVNTKSGGSQQSVNALRREIQALTGDMARAKAQSDLLNRFDAATAMNLQPRAIKDYTNDFQLLLNLAGSLDETRATRFGASLERSRDRVRGIAEEIARLKAGPATAAAAAQVDNYLSQIRTEVSALVRELAQLDPARFSEKQLNRLISANRRLQGDIAGLRGSAMAGQLALQQLTFAVDDFFSSTGGFEYKLRAISNNISQFGFILGGTKGLIAGVAATVGAQLLIQFGGIGKASKEAEGGLKFMNDELEKSRSLAEQTTKAFKDMAKALESASTPGGRGQIERRLQELRDEQKKQREADVKSRDPAVVEAAGRRSALEEQASKASGAERVRLLRELERARAIERQAIRGSATQRPLGDVRNILERARSLEMRTLEGRQGASLEMPVVTEAYQRSARLAALRAERISTPTNASDAAAQVRGRIEELQKTLGSADIVEKALARLSDSVGFNVAPFPIANRNDIQALRDTNKLIAELDGELARLEAVIKEGADNLANTFAEQVLSAEEEIKGVFSTLANLGLDSDIQSRFSAQFEAPAKALADAAKEVEERLKNNPEADISDLQDKASAAARSLEALYQQADRLSRDVALGSLVPTGRRLQSAAEIAASVGGPTLAGANAARIAQDLQEAENRRRRAELRGDTAGVAAADRQIDTIRLASGALEEAAIAVRSFQAAVERAALALSQTLVQEATAEADRMRRRANRLASDPMMAESAAAARDAAEARRRAEEDSNRQLDADLARERLAFERDINAGRDPRAAALARDVREGRQAQGNRGLSAEDQLAGKERADRAQAELDRLFDRRAGVQAAREAEDRRDAARQAEIERTRRVTESETRGVGILQSILGDNARMAASLGGGAVTAAAELDRQMEEAKRRVEEAASAGVEMPDVLRDELSRLAGAISDQRDAFVRRLVERERDRAGGFSAQSDRARKELESSGVFASDVQGTLTELEVRRRALEQQRDALLQDPANADAAAAIQGEIDAMDVMAAEANAAAIAVAGFQQAANRAALELQKSVESDVRGASESARRRANEAEAVFGVGSPEAKRAREQQRRLEDATKQAEDEAARARRAVADERVKFEKDILEGRNPAAKARADKIAELERQAADENLSAADQEAARAEADRLRREQEREFRNRPGVRNEQRKADEADRRRAELESAQRGRDLMKTERQRREEELRAQAGDIGNAVKEMRAEGVPRRQINQQVQNAANTMARQAAPLLAQFADEVMNSRLAGPSRAALNAQDIQTTEGAKELNRLLRGDDASKDVNILELRRQSELLQAIENAIKAQTGVVVDL